MIFDTADSAPFDVSGDYDVCIAGGGVAGIVIAVTMAEQGKRVLLLEAGGLSPSLESQDIYKGAIIGKEYRDLSLVRLRYLGGSSNHWGGFCRPLEPYDFESRPQINESGWPISYSDVHRHQAKACEIFGFEDFPEPDYPERAFGNLAHVEFRYSLVAFGVKYMDTLTGSDAIDVVLNANVTDVELDTENGAVTHFEYRGYGEGAPRKRASARNYVIAMGGLENPRFLLNANRQLPNGVGNQNDLVGRYFMEHPHFTIGEYAVDPSVSDFGRDREFLIPTQRFMDDNRVATCAVRFDQILFPTSTGLGTRIKERTRNFICNTPSVKRVYNIFDSEIYCPPPWLRFVTAQDSAKLRAVGEQAPNPSSRVKLIEERDSLGQRRIALDWRLTDFEKRTMKTSVLEAARFFARADYGRIRLEDWFLDDAHPFLDMSDGEEVIGPHHMGTTRMASSPHHGVVDADCKVFGTTNLYIAGSSVFPTCGYANPTFTIVQLALRMADHLARA